MLLPQTMNLKCWSLVRDYASDKGAESQSTLSLFFLDVFLCPQSYSNLNIKHSPYRPLWKHPLLTAE